MKIPYEELKTETLKALIEEFVTRAGTDYGEEEAALDGKVEQIMEQLKNGKASIVFDQESGTCNII